MTQSSVDSPSASAAAERRLALLGLASLPRLSVATLGQLATFQSPERTWAELRDSPSPPSHPELPPAIQRGWSAWHAAAGAFDTRACAVALGQAGIWWALPGDDRYPAAIADDLAPPPVLFGRGDPTLLRAPCVAIVGTRRCTRYGRKVATDLAAALDDVGVVVVSGLARGIDAAAHRGALAGAWGRTAAVVGCGLDGCYPREHRSLMSAITTAGVVLSEAPMGAAPAPWRFPARNRLLAALSVVVVVVESAEAGGSLHTVNEAIARGVDVLAVPGPIGVEASRGTNKLIAEGCAPCLGVDDVIAALSLVECVPPGTPPPRSEPDGAPTHLEDADETAGPSADPLDWIGAEPAALEDLVAYARRPPLEVIAALEQAKAQGSIEEVDGWWSRVVAP